MALINEIEYDTDPDTFLKATEIESLQDLLNVSEINKIIENDIYSALNKIPGLTKEAFSIGTRAPLYEIKEHLRYSLNNIWEGLTDTNEAIMYSGNDHRQKEANKLWEKVTNRFNELSENINEAVQDYDDKRPYHIKKTKSRTNDKGEKETRTETELRWYNKCTVCSSIDSGVKIKLSPSSYDKNDTDHEETEHDGYVGAIYKAVEDAQKFYDDIVTRAKTLKEECDVLPTSKPGYDPTPQDEKIQLHKRDSSGTGQNSGKISQPSGTDSNPPKEEQTQSDDREDKIATDLPIAESYEDIQECVKEGKNFYLKPGFRLDYDGDAFYYSHDSNRSKREGKKAYQIANNNMTITATDKTGKILFEKGENGIYYAYYTDNEGKKVEGADPITNAFGYGGMQAERLVDGLNAGGVATPSNDTTLYYDNMPGLVANNSNKKKYYDKQKISAGESGENK